MPYTVDWYPGYEGRIIHETLEGNISIEEIAAAAQEVVQRMQLAVAPAHVFINLQKLKSFPLRANQIKDAAVYLKEPSLGTLVLIGGSSLMGTFAGIIGQLAGVKLRNFASYDEALAFMLHEDHSLER